MIFIINDMKWDTDKMELVSDKIDWKYPGFWLMIPVKGCLWRSKKGNWLITYKSNGNDCAEVISSKEAMRKLLNEDYKKYEELFGQIEEA